MTAMQVLLRGISRPHIWSSTRLTHAKYAGSLSPADTTGPTLVAGRPPGPLRLACNPRTLANHNNLMMGLTSLRSCAAASPSSDMCLEQPAVGAVPGQSSRCGCRPKHLIFKALKVYLQEFVSCGWGQTYQNTKKYENIRKNTKTYEKIRKRTKKYENIRKNTMDMRKNTVGIRKHTSSAVYCMYPNLVIS